MNSEDLKVGTLETAQAIIAADRNRRAQELMEIIQREATRLQCDVTASVQIIPR